MNELQQSKRTLLITGAAGFLGQQAVEKALADGYRVVAVVRPRGDDGRVETAALTALRRKYPAALAIEQVNLEDEVSVQALMARHPEMDGVMHSAAMLKVPMTPEGVAKAHHINVDATQYLAKACEEQAKTTGRIIQFHFVSSINALQFERDESLLPSPESVPYARSKCEAAKWLNLSQKEKLPHLDISVTYPTNIIGPVPSKGLPSFLLTLAQTDDAGKPRNMRREYEQMGLADKAFQRMKFVNSENYLRDIFSCFEPAARTQLDIPPSPGFHEHSIKADYYLSIGELTRLIGQVIDQKRPGAPTAVPETQLQLPNMGTSHKSNVHLRFLNHPPDAPAHETINLRDVLSAQYDAIAQQTRRTSGIT